MGLFDVAPGAACICGRLRPVTNLVPLKYLLGGFCDIRNFICSRVLHLVGFLEVYYVFCSHQRFGTLRDRLWGMGDNYAGF